MIFKFVKIQKIGQEEHGHLANMSAEKLLPCTLEACWLFAAQSWHTSVRAACRAPAHESSEVDLARPGRPGPPSATPRLFTDADEITDDTRTFLITQKYMYMYFNLSLFLI